MAESREISSEIPKYLFRPLFLVGGFFCGFIVGAFADCIVAESRQDSYLTLKSAPYSGMVGVVIALVSLVFENRLPSMLRDRHWRSLGGLLAIANASLVFLVAVAIRFRCPLPGYFEVFLVAVLILPVFWGLFVPQIDGGGGFTDKAIFCVLIGLNAIAWGYLVAAIFKKMQSTVRHHRQQQINADKS